MLGSIITGVVGTDFVILGYLIWKKERISLLHGYHYDKVSDEDKKAFCSVSGQGVLLIGISLLITAVVIGITDSVWSFVAFAVGFAVGLAMLIYASIKYNH